MVSLSVKELEVRSINTGECYKVFGVANRNAIDYFICYNENLRKERSGFVYIKVIDCMPICSNTLLE